MVGCSVVGVPDVRNNGATLSWKAFGNSTVLSPVAFEFKTGGYIRRVSCSLRLCRLILRVCACKHHQNSLLW